MTDQLPDLMDELLRQFANEGLYAKMEARKKEIERLASEIEALTQQLDALRTAPGDPRQEIADLEAKIRELEAPFDTRKDELRNIMSQFEQFMKIAASVNETLTRAVEKVAQRIGR
jgi:chromosome segregation ATPase